MKFYEGLLHGSRSILAYGEDSLLNIKSSRDVKDADVSANSIRSAYVDV